MSTVVEAELPIEEDDISQTEQHNELVDRIKYGLRRRLADTLVLGDIFVRDGRRQASPDVFTVPGGRPGSRNVFRLEDEPPVDVTIEVLSDANKHDRDGVLQLHRKRKLLAEIGITEHIELDPLDGVILVFRLVDGDFEPQVVTTEYVSQRLGGVRFVVDPSVAEGFRVFDSGGVEFERPDDAMRRADEQQARADEQQARADEQQARAERLEALLRAAGVDPGSAGA